MKWMPIPEYEGLYSISDTGLIRSEKNGIKRPYTTSAGYKQVNLYSNGKRKSLSVSRLLALVYIPNPNNYPIINHVNGIKTDNRIDNLEWCTQSMNVLHALRTGLVKTYNSRRAK